MQPQYSPYPHIPYQPPAPSPDPAAVARRRGWLAVGTAAAGVAAIVGVAAAVQSNTTTNGIGSAAFPSIQIPNGSSGSGGTGSGSSGAGGGASTTSSGSATATQSVGVVDINTVLGYQGAAAAGTGIVLTSSGEILTNNHVIDGATKIKVTVVSTGRSYSATVVGTDPTDDVAVIQLTNASGLPTAAIGDSSGVKVGDSITGVGNAGGAGGTPSAAHGQIVALDQSLTASDNNGANAERLTGMIEVNAPIVAGDSGGPLYSSGNKIIGIDTAAQTNGRTTTVGYAIPIAKAIGIANLIESGQASSTVHIGLPAFLGVSVANSTGGALIEGVVPNGPADQAGITAGDTVTAVDGTSVTSGPGLKTALSSHHSGDRVTIHWTDRFGATHSARVTLITGPAD